MINILNTIILTISLMGYSEKANVVRSAVDAANETMPAKTWDGQHIESVKLIEEENIVELYIQDVGGHKPNSEDIENGELVKGGTWFIANFMTGYDYSVKGKGGEGDEKMFIQVGRLLKLLVGNKIGIRFKFDFRNGDSFSFDMSPQDVAIAVKLRKNTFYEKYYK